MKAIRVFNSMTGKMANEFTISDSEALSVAIAIGNNTGAPIVRVFHDNVTCYDRNGRDMYSISIRDCEEV